MKYGNLTLGQIEALCNILGGEEEVERLLKGEITVEIKEAVKKLFDKNGRLIPPANLQSKVCDPDKNFYLNQPKMETVSDFQERLEILEESLGIKVGITAEQFKEQIENLLEKIKADPKNANVLNGVYLPVILPKFQFDDLGEEIERLLIGVEKSYQKNFPNRVFKNYRKGDLKNKVKAVCGHENFVEDLKKDFVIGIYFPSPMQGFSINASREYVLESFSLSGIDAIIGMIMYPDVLARDYNIPGLDLSGLEWQSAGCSLFFRADGADLDFGNADNLSNAHDFYSSGFFFR